MVNLFLTIIRALFALIDSIVVWLIKNLYVLLVQIANTNVFGSFIYQMLGRIYVFLGIFMLFKLTLSMITYIVNPDAMTDKSKGFSKLITNVVISLILIVTVPSIFREAYRLQALILNSNAVYQIVTGRGAPASTNTNSALALEANAESLADQIARSVFSSFVYEDKEVSASTTKVEAPKCDDAKGCSGGTCTTAECYVAVSTVTKDGNGTHGFANEYKFLLSTIVGAVVAYFFLVFCLDAAVRAIKLGVLQIIAPIPILSMIDPKGGNDKLKKWASNCGKEYAGLFIRLAGVFFATEVIRLITDENTDFLRYYASDGTIGDKPVGFLVKLFIIIGLLMFAKQFPQFIEQVLGIKLSSGDGGFNLKKRLGSMPGMGLAKMAGAGALGFAGGLGANLAAGFNKRNYSWDKNKGFMKNLGHNVWGVGKHAFSTLGGGFSAGARGATSKEKNLFKATGAGIKGSSEKRNLRDKRQDAGYNIGKRTVDKMADLAGMDGFAKQESDKLYGNITNLQRQQAQYDRIAQEELLTKNYSDSYLNQLNSLATSAKIDKSGQIYWERKKQDGSVVNEYVSSLANTQYANDVKYIEAIAKSNDANIRIAKENKKLKLYQSESKK